MWILLALLSGSCAAVLAILVKLYLHTINPFFITFVFSIITVLLLGGIDFCTNKVECKMLTSLTIWQWIPLIIAGCINGLAFVCYMSALQHGKAGGVVAVDRLGIVTAVILAAIFLQETLSIKALIGSMFMVIGAVIMSM